MASTEAWNPLKLAACITLTSPEIIFIQRQVLSTSDLSSEEEDLGEQCPQEEARHFPTLDPSSEVSDIMIYIRLFWIDKCFGKYI